MVIHQRQFSKVRYGTQKALHSTIEANTLGGAYYFWCPFLTLDEIVHLANSMKLRMQLDREAFMLSFVLTYLREQGTPWPSQIEFESVNMLTHLSNERKSDTMFGFGGSIETFATGFVGRDPELNVTAQGTPVTNFSLPVEKYRGQNADGTAKNETVWYRVICWQDMAEKAEKWVHKGALVYVRGDLEARPYTDREGVQRVSMEITARDLRILKKAAQNGEATGSKGNGGDPFLPDYPDDVS